MRGKQKAAALDYLPIGITPAGAGKTVYFVGYEKEDKDHPRRCGENALSANGYDVGKRITPAGAGKTM